MAAQERDQLTYGPGINKILHFAGKIKSVGQAIFNHNEDGNWVVIDAEELTPQRLEEFLHSKPPYIDPTPRK